MVFKSFRVGLVFRVILLCASIAAAMYSILVMHWGITSLVAALVVILFILELFSYISRTNKEMARFLAGIRFGDYTRNVGSQTSDMAFDELHQAFQVIIMQFQSLNAEKETQYHYLQSVVEHIKVGILTYDDRGETSLYNQAAADLLQMPYLKNINVLDKKHPELLALLQEMVPGERKMVQIESQYGYMALSVSASYTKLPQGGMTLVSLQNIGPELNETETEAWQKLMRVLMHEIMNSLTPITSLSSSAVNMLDTAEGKPDDVLPDLKMSLQTIEKRSKGLLNFVDIYRTLTRLPKPQVQAVTALRLFEGIATLMQKSLDERHISLEIILKDPRLEILIDPELMEQVLINLMLNAMEAVKDKTDATIQLSAHKDGAGRAVLMISDNGTGMNEEVMEKIFIPFYTTRPNGSGIGLSLSQQIMHLHSGSISVKSSPGNGSVFMLRF